MSGTACLLDEAFHNSPARIRAFLEERGLAAQKRFGQHFLISPHARRQIFRALDPHPDDTVWEVGPGLGAASAPALAAGARLCVFEIDRGFCAALRGQFDGAYPRTWRLFEGDVLRGWEQAAREEGGAGPGSRLFLGNLPYNIAGALIGNFIEQGFFFRRCVVTVQKEVGERLMAESGAAGYSSLSVLRAAVYNAARVAFLPPSCFYPAPAVDSVCLRFDLKTEFPAYPPEFFRFVRAMFASRRKTAANNLRVYLGGASASRAASLFEAAGIAPRLRAEDLRLEDFRALFDRFC